MHLSETTGKPALSQARLFNDNLIRGLEIAHFQPSPRAYAETQLSWSLTAVASRCSKGFKFGALTTAKFAPET